MKRIKAGKLVFEREVLRRLSSGDLGQVHGAGKTYDCTKGGTCTCNGATAACGYTAKNGCATDTCMTHEYITCGCPVLTNGTCQIGSAFNC